MATACTSGVWDEKERRENVWHRGPLTPEFHEYFSGFPHIPSSCSCNCLDLKWASGFDFLTRHTSWVSSYPHLQGKQRPLSQVVGVEQLELVEKLDEKMWARLILGYQRGDLRVDGFPQRLEEGEVTAGI